MASAASCAPVNGGAQSSTVIPPTPLIFSSVGMSKELGLLLGGYYYLCEETFSKDLEQEEARRESLKRARKNRRQQRLLGTDAATESSDHNVAECGTSAHHTSRLVTPLPTFRAAAHYLDGLEGLSPATSAKEVTTKNGTRLHVAFRKDANGKMILEL